jgi:quercetin dioxygenase-like cupin family protein
MTHRARDAIRRARVPDKETAAASPRAAIMPFTCNEPAVPTVQQDDATVRITRWDFAPGAATGWHTHGWPYFVVLLTDAVMKIEAGGEVSEVRLVAGQSYRRPAGIEHDVMNGGDAPMAFVEIEIKRPEDLGRA